VTRVCRVRTAIDPVVRDRLAGIATSLPGVAIRVRRSRRTLLSLRRGPTHLRLGLDPRLLLNPESSVLLIEWVRDRGRGDIGKRMREVLRGLMRASGAELDTIPSSLATLPTVEPGLDLASACAAVHARWFTDLPLPPIGWARAVHRRISSIRFGCYRRGPPSRISIHPRLTRPWVARVFLDHVIYHELCHHRQFRQPLGRRERLHSLRFRAWERAFPGHDEAMAWERACLPWLLDDAPPPWYRQPQNPSGDPV
jgi:hypothetical protein